MTRYFVYGCPACGAYEHVPADEHEPFGDDAAGCPVCPDGGAWIRFGPAPPGSGDRFWWKRGPNGRMVPNDMPSGGGNTVPPDDRG
jgi:hypothetical protein